jgi:serine/threonine protein phosphatase PrpC
MSTPARRLLATDGLLKYAPAGRVADICRGQYEDCTQRLIDLVRYPSGGLPDDVTLILASLNRSSGL